MIFYICKQREQDEVEFLDTIEKRQKQVEDTAKEQEERELLAFRLRSAVAKENALKEDGKASESRSVIFAFQKWRKLMLGYGADDRVLSTLFTDPERQRGLRHQVRVNQRSFWSPKKAHLRCKGLEMKIKDSKRRIQKITNKRKIRVSRP